jgi:hypothetical protein
MIQRFILWCYTAPVLEWFRNAKYAIPVLQSFHLAGITAVLGVICIISIRLLGLGMLKISLRTLWRELSGWFLGALIMTITAGVIIAIIDPTRYLANTPFRIKMCCLAAAIVFHYTIFRSSVRNAPDEETPRTTTGHAALGCASLLLWFSVGWAGRFIAFFQ